MVRVGAGDGSMRPRSGTRFLTPARCRVGATFGIAWAADA